MEQIEQKTTPPLGGTKPRDIIEIMGDICEHCKGSRARSVHHIIARKRGGQHYEDNLIALCPNCHDDADRDFTTIDELEHDISKRSDEQKRRIVRILANKRTPRNNSFQEESYSNNRNDSMSRNIFVPESSGIHPKINTIKMQVCKGLLEGKSVIQLSKIIYPDREQGRSTYHLMYRQVQEVEKDGLIRVTQRPTSESDYIDIKIEEITDGVFGLEQISNVTNNKINGNSREQVICAICDQGLTFEQAAIKYDHQGDGERDGRQKVGNLVKRHIKLAIDKGTVIDNGNGTYSRV